MNGFWDGLGKIVRRAMRRDVTPAEAKFAAKPWILVRHEQEIRWTPADRDWLAAVQEHSTWKKARMILEDFMLNDILPGPGKILDSEYISAFAAGQLKFLERMERMSGKKATPLDPEVGGEGEGEKKEGEPEGEKYPVQM